MLFQNKPSISYYAISIIAILILTLLNQKWNSLFQRPSDNYEMIKQYLLNDSPLEGFSRPKLWIHSKFELNSRCWQSFMSRSNSNLNQPYLELFIKSIMNHCADDFHICLIDDESFGKLLPHWTIKVHELSDPLKSFYRHMGLMEILYLYGGMVLPNSTLALTNLYPLFLEYTENKSLFFSPTFLCLGVPQKNHPTLRVYLDKLLAMSGSSSLMTNQQSMQSEMTSFLESQPKEKVKRLCGKSFGQLTVHGERILIDHWMEEDFLKLDPGCVAIYIDSDELLKRNKYQWYAVLPIDNILETSCILTKYMKAALVGSKNPQQPKEILPV